MSGSAGFRAGPTDDATELICGIVENGPWVRITDPALREIVRGHVVDACHAIALYACLGEAMRVAGEARPRKLVYELPASDCDPNDNPVQ